jgi:hypothetical protein
MNRRQTVPPAQKYTVKDFEREFPDDDACLEAIMQWRFPEGKTLCVACGVVRKHYRVSGRTAYSCCACVATISIRWLEPYSINPLLPSAFGSLSSALWRVRGWESAPSISREKQA